MTKLFSSGDLVRIPQGVMLCSGNHYLVLDRQKYGIFHKIVKDDVAEIIFEDNAWEVDIQSIYEGDI
jgi:hypothetical protein